MAVGRERRRALCACEPAPAQNVLDAVADVGALKRAIRGDLARQGARAQRPTGAPNPLSQQADFLLAQPQPGPPQMTSAGTVHRLYPGARTASPEKIGARIKTRNPESQATFNAVTRINHFRAIADVQLPLDELAPLLDPRAWAAGGGVIDRSFLLTVERGEYRPALREGEADLGSRWNSTWPGERPWLLYEFAKTDAASFENVLEITRFDVQDDAILMTYRLHDCLKCMIGFLTFDGGLVLNDGFCRVTPIKNHKGWSRIEVVKRVRVRDLTPNDTGDQFDFGQWVNTTIGVALSLWVDDIAMLTPFS